MLLHKLGKIFSDRRTQIVKYIKDGMYQLPVQEFLIKI